MNPLLPERRRIMNAVNGQSNLWLDLQAFGWLF
jgi:hypothetical protein